MYLKKRALRWGAGSDQSAGDDIFARSQGTRDYALLATMFNTGARVQEILDLRPSDVQLVSPAHVRLLGKGRKERLCPLWPQTAQLLRAYLSERGLTPASTAAEIFSACAVAFATSSPIIDGAKAS